MYAGNQVSDASPFGSGATRGFRAPSRSPARLGASGSLGTGARQGTVRGAGKVFLVGAGPGDPDLLTVKAHRLISQAQVVVFDHLVGDAIVDLIPAAARRVYAGKEAGNHALPQHAINRLLVELASEGLDVVRLKGGDPFIFGRGGEEMQAVLDAGLECEIVPGITAAAGAASCTGIPLTHREHAQTL
ncbi:MAG: uroporphyrinogen-III C-methyltransferase, partial [Gammaproteobacteria bacterium]